MAAQGVRRRELPAMALVGPAPAVRGRVTGGEQWCRRAVGAGKANALVDLKAVLEAQRGSGP
ncbi:hypothetical protein AQI95_06765 [Streptomyces yokosukanensis]|uniref:Uncharacterized protein n=1 Tax=Streptomyces yokosukanensis TaxID=67386 RepID=A0A101PC14_9ACTN|nr:hypothetical protein [Streptomyces yokosukanensis]KUN08715.1 hypothetical protein AQI95_06765 [Streptomyces yokosukanensis]